MVDGFFFGFLCLTSLCVGVSFENIRFFVSLAVWRSRLCSNGRMLASYSKLFMGVVR